MWKLTVEESTQPRRPVQFLVEYFRGKKLSSELGLRANASPARFAEQAVFDLLLRNNDSEITSVDPVFSGLYSSGRASQMIMGWVDGDYFDTVTFPPSNCFSLGDASLDHSFFRILGDIVPPGGSLMISYSLFSRESMIHRETKQGLDRGYPPVTTPLGFLLFTAGCGMSFKDWYFAEGGGEGPTKLQGYKPVDSQMAKKKATLMFQELRVFTTIHESSTDDLARRCMSRVDQILHELKKYT